MPPTQRKKLFEKGPSDRDQRLIDSLGGTNKKSEKNKNKVKPSRPFEGCVNSSTRSVVKRRTAGEPSLGVPFVRDSRVYEGTTRVLTEEPTISCD